VSAGTIPVSAERPDARDRRTAVTDWVRATAGDRLPADFTGSTPLFANGLLDSLNLLDLVLLIEELRGHPVAAGELTPAAIRDIDAICAAFFAEDRR
jgi:acyl carrier protein